MKKASPTFAIRYAVQFTVSSTWRHDEHERNERQPKLPPNPLKHDHAIFDSAAVPWAYPWQEGAQRELDGGPVPSIRRKPARIDHGHFRPIHEHISDKLAGICGLDS